jgi:5-methyltetrahydropteroyltriglutamate--homocysteine methyltransferase
LKRSTGGILTTHVGKLTAPDELTQEMVVDARGRPTNPAFASRLQHAVLAVVQRQAEIGIDIPGDGEFGKTSWNSYLIDRLGGYELVPLQPGVTGRPLGGSERSQFEDFYKEAETSEHMAYYRRPVTASLRDTQLRCIAPVTYTGMPALQQDIENLKSSMTAVHVVEAFMPSTAPNAALERNLYYTSEEAYLFALADAMKEEYEAIVEAGLILQVDMPGINGSGDAIQQIRIDALNHALTKIPEERVRVHVCWGGWNGPHTTDPALRDALPSMFKIHAGGYSFEAANPRHEHEWEVWQDIKLREGKVLYPGFISQKTNVVEHPETVAWRIKLYAGVVGRENVVASTDCGARITRSSSDCLGETTGTSGWSSTGIQGALALISAIQSTGPTGTALRSPGPMQLSQLLAKDQTVSPDAFDGLEVRSCDQKQTDYALFSLECAPMVHMFNHLILTVP